MTLKDLNIGETAVVGTVGGEGALRQHFLDMGLIPRTAVKLMKVAPMGDPIEVELRGYELTVGLYLVVDTIDLLLQKPHLLLVFRNVAFQAAYLLLAGFVVFLDLLRFLLKLRYFLVVVLRILKSRASHDRYGRRCKRSHRCAQTAQYSFPDIIFPHGIPSL